MAKFSFDAVRYQALVSSANQLSADAKILADGLQTFVHGLETSFDGAPEVWRESQDGDDIRGLVDELRGMIAPIEGLDAQMPEAPDA